MLLIPSVDKINVYNQFKKKFADRENFLMSAYFSMFELNSDIIAYYQSNADSNNYLNPNFNLFDLIHFHNCDSLLDYAVFVDYYRDFIYFYLTLMTYDWWGSVYIAGVVEDSGIPKGSFCDYLQYLHYFVCQYEYFKKLIEKFYTKSDIIIKECASDSSTNYKSFIENLNLVFKDFSIHAEAIIERLSSFLDEDFVRKEMCLTAEPMESLSYDFDSYRVLDTAFGYNMRQIYLEVLVETVKELFGDNFGDITVKDFDDMSEKEESEYFKKRLYSKIADKQEKYLKPLIKELGTEKLKSNLNKIRVMFLMFPLRVISFICIVVFTFLFDFVYLPKYDLSLSYVIVFILSFVLMCTLGEIVRSVFELIFCKTGMDHYFPAHFKNVSDISETDD